MDTQVCLFNNITIRFLIFGILLLLTQISFANVGFTNTTLTLQEDSGTTTIGLDLVDAFAFDGAISSFSVDYAVTGGTATAGVDYTALGGTLVFNFPADTPTFDLTILEDLDVSPNETIVITLSNCIEQEGFSGSGSGPCGTFSGDGEGDPGIFINSTTSSETITIVDTTTPGTLSFSSSTASVTEGETTTLTVTRTGGSDGAVSVDYATMTDGSSIAAPPGVNVAAAPAEPGADFISTSGTLNWADGDSSPKTFTVTALSDAVVEEVDTFLVTLSNPGGGATLGNISTSTVSIIDNTNNGTINLSSSIASVTEGQIVTITASRTGGSDGTVSVDFATADSSAIAGSDYTTTSGTLTWTDADTSDKTFTITALSDTDTEADETFSVALSNVSGGATLGTVSSSVVTIVDSTSPGTIGLSSTTASVIEGETTTITVSRTGGSDGIVSIDYATADGDALAGSDYTAASGTLSWTDGDITDKSFTVTALSDNDTEVDETLSVTLSNISGGATLGTASGATITIIDATSPGTISLNSPTASVVEGGEATFTVSRTGGSDGAISVDYTTSDSSAVAGTDYTATSGTLNWADGDSTDKSFTVTGLEDGVVDGDETFTVTLSNVTGNATLGAAPATTVTIVETSQLLGELEGLTPQQRSVANAIDELCNGATGDLLAQCLDIIAIDRPNDEKIAIINAVTPTQISAQGSNAVDFGFQQLQTIHGRIVNLRQKNKSGEKISLAGFTMNSFGQQIPLGQMAQTLLYNALDEVGGEESLRDSPLGVFLKGQISIGEKESTGAEKGFDVDNKSLTFGVDYQLTDELVLGIASGYAHSNNDFANSGGKMESNSGNFSLYGSYFLPEDFYVDMILSYAIHNYDNSRTIAFPGLQTSATSDVFGDQYGGSLGFGKDFYLKSFFFSPYVRFEYLRTGIDEYSEQGGGIFALRVAEQSMFSLASTLGGQVNRAISMPWGIISPGLRFEWRHQFKDDQRTIQSRFINAPAGTGFFSINTDDPDRDYFNLGASLAVTLPEGRSAFLRYETRLGQNDISSHTIEVLIRIPF